MRSILWAGWALLWATSWATLPVASAQVVQPLQGTPPAVVGALGPGCPALERGEFARFFRLPVEAGQTYVLRVETQGFAARLLAGLPDGAVTEAAARQPGDPVELTFTAPRSGPLLIALTSLAPGQAGSFRLASTLPVSAKSQPAPPAATATTKPEPTALPSSRKPPAVPPAPRFEGAKTMTLKQLGAPLQAPTPVAATVKTPGVLAQTLHLMNYLCVTAGGWSEVRETNWLYPLADVAQHKSPRHFYAEADNQFWDAGEARNYTVPLQWTGNVFSASHRRNLDERGNLEMLDVTGTVSPNGDRIEWVMIRECVQEAYWDEAGKQALLRRRLWKTLSLVDLPLRNLHYNAQTDPLEKRFTTMQERLKMVSPGLMTERMLNEGFHYGYSDARDAGPHVLDLGYLEQDPAVKNAPYLDPAQIHTVEYRSTSWAEAGGGTARVSFERRNNTRQP